MKAFSNISTAQTLGVVAFDSADGKTEKTGATLSAFLCKQGDTSYSPISPTITEIGSGLYTFPLSTTHDNTSGMSHVRLTGSGCDPINVPNAVDVIAVEKTSTTRGFGGTALPNAAAEAAGGLVTNGTGTGQLSVSGGRAKADTVYWNAAAVSVPTNAGVPNVNAKTWNDLATVALPLVPTVAGRTLDVSVGGEAGLDWANVGSPTTVVGLSGTTVKTATDVETDTQDLQARTPAALVSGRMDSSVGAMASGVLTDTAIAADAITDAKVASDVTIASVTGSVGSVTGAVGSVTGSVGSIATDGITAASLATAAVSKIADAIFDYVIEAAPVGATTFIQRLRVKWSLLMGIASGLNIPEGGTESFRDAADTKDRATFTLAEDGTRVPGTFDGT